MLIGTIVKWNADRGFGFIRPDLSSEPDVFAHIAELVDEDLEELPEGVRVQYETVRSKRRPGTFEAREIVVMKD